ncbi:hypothetical protein BH11ARM1_BH11ARM1_01060 [soil metagenome]
MTRTQRPFLLIVAQLLAMAVVASASGQYQPADPKASPQVRAMLNYLKQQSGKGFVSGQTDLKDTVWIRENTGKLPAILGLDFHRAPKRAGHETGDTAVAIDWFKNKHGLVTYQWHWSAPGAKDIGSGFYSKDNPFDLSLALKDPKSDDYRALIADIDDVAAELKKMSDAHVPGLFRPLHEAQGGWFWWGSRGPESCTKLYDIIFDRITKTHNLHNIAWVWVAYPESQQKGDPKAWYPGDNKVDIVASDYCEKKQDFDDLVKLTNDRKMVALAETMNAPDPDRLLADIPWAYWVTWARRDWHSESDDDMKRAMSREKTITIDKLPEVTKW